MKELGVKKCIPMGMPGFVVAKNLEAGCSYGVLTVNWENNLTSKVRPEWVRKVVDDVSCHTYTYGGVYFVSLPKLCFFFHYGNLLFWNRFGGRPGGPQNPLAAL